MRVGRPHAREGTSTRTLSNASPAALPDRVEAARYDRRASTVGIVQLGVGVLPHDARMIDVLREQDGLCALVITHPDGTPEPRVIGSAVDARLAPAAARRPSPMPSVTIGAVHDGPGDLRLTGAPGTSVTIRPGSEASITIGAVCQLRNSAAQRDPHTGVHPSEPRSV